MSSAQDPFADIAALAALGSNVVRFVPPHRDEPSSQGSEWAAGLDLIDQAAAFISASEQRVSMAEARAEKVAAKAIEGVRSAQQRVEQAEAHTRQIEQHAAEEIRRACERMAEVEAWAQGAEERARDAEHRAQAAESRAHYAEEWLSRLTDALRQKLSFGAAPAQTAEDALRALRLSVG